MNTPRSLPPSPPARGSFPLDHHGQCKDAMRVYLVCMKTHSEAHHLCKDESKSYLACRMERQVSRPSGLCVVPTRAAARLSQGADGEGRPRVHGVRARVERRDGQARGRPRWAVLGSCACRSRGKMTAPLPPCLRPQTRSSPACPRLGRGPASSLGSAAVPSLSSGEYSPTSSLGRPAYPPRRPRQPPQLPGTAQRSATRGAAPSPRAPRGPRSSPSSPPA